MGDIMQMEIVNGIFIGVAASGIVGFVTNYLTRGTALQKLANKLDVMASNVDEIRRRVAAIELKVHGFSLSEGHLKTVKAGGDD